MINKVTLIGRAGKDPDLHTTKSDKKVVKFTVATWENYKDDNSETGWKQVTEWHNVVVWGAAAVTLNKQLKKGGLVYVDGQIQTRSYEDKDGNTKYITEIIGYAKALLTEKTTESAKPKEEKKEPAKENEKPGVDDLSDLPF